MDTENIFREEKKKENNENFTNRLKGFINKETGWITIPVTAKMTAENSHLATASSKYIIR